MSLGGYYRTGRAGRDGLQQWPGMCMGQATATCAASSTDRAGAPETALEHTSSKR